MAVHAKYQIHTVTLLLILMAIVYQVCQLFCSVKSFSDHSILDVFLMCGTNRKWYQIWINNKSNGFKMAQTQSFPPNIGAVTFADMGKWRVQLCETVI